MREEEKLPIPTFVIYHTELEQFVFVTHTKNHMLDDYKLVDELIDATVFQYGGGNDVYDFDDFMDNQIIIDLVTHMKLSDDFKYFVFFACHDITYHPINLNVCAGWIDYEMPLIVCAELDDRIDDTLHP